MPMESDDHMTIQNKEILSIYQSMDVITVSDDLKSYSPEM